MPSLLSLLTSGLSLAPLASSTKIVKFINHCPYNIWFWEVGPAASHIDGSNAYRSMVPAKGGSIVHNMVDTERLGSGLSLKIRDKPYYAVAPAGIIQVEYHLEASKGAMWYDLSAVDCDLNVGPENARYCPLVRGGIKLYIPKHPNKKDCSPAYCNKDRCWNTYVRPGGFQDEPTFMCWAGADLFVETCTDGPGVQTFNGKDPKVLDAVHQAIPEYVAQPPPVYFEGLIPSPNGKCGGTTSFTCTGSQHGVCCSTYGYCGNSPEHCNAGCQAPFGLCSAQGEMHPRDASSEPIVVPTATSTSATPQTVTGTEMEIECDTVFHQVLETETVTHKAGAMFTPPPLLLRGARRGGMGYVAM